MDGKFLPIGVFDSGVGGVFVLRQAYRLLPEENFIFYGDLGHAPYGTRKLDEIQRISMNAAQYLVDQGIKALLVACNTATSAAIELMRQKFSMPIVGIEPALKPAMEVRRQGKIAVMATPATLRLPKFNKLMEDCCLKQDLISIPCPGLSQMVERYGPGAVEINDYLNELFSHTERSDLDAVVVGCTHYSFLAKDLRKVLGPVPLFDGAQGAARQLARLLNLNELTAQQTGTVRFETSGTKEDMALLMRFWKLSEDFADD